MAAARLPARAPRVKSRTSSAPPGRSVAASPAPDAPTPPASRAGSSSAPSGPLVGPLVAGTLAAAAHAFEHATSGGDSPDTGARRGVLSAIVGALLALARLVMVWATPEGERLRASAAALALASSPEPSSEPSTDPAPSRDWASFVVAAGERIEPDHTAHGDSLGSTPRPLTAADLADLREQTADIVAAGLDATAPPGKRRLGRSEARRQIIEAAEKCRATFALAEKGGAA